MAKKRKRDADFVKAKQKVGKQKLVPTSLTSTEFRARSAALPAQSQFSGPGAGPGGAHARRKALGAAELEVSMMEFHPEMEQTPCGVWWKDAERNEHHITREELRLLVEADKEAQQDPQDRT